MKFTLSAPSKTFLVGEYAVLQGAPALILNTQPRFELVARAVASLNDEGVIGINGDSPAGVWLKQRAPLLEGWHLTFIDPHSGRGGLGASSAQFLLVHSFTTSMQKSFNDFTVNQKDMWNDFQVVSGGNGSGADVLAQAAGGVAYTEMKPLGAQNEEWPYPEIGFVVLRTGRKLATHEYLRTLNRERLSPLVQLAQNACDAFDAEPAEEFLVQVSRYARALRQLEVQSPLTLSLLAPFEKQEWCLVAKGCGAMGTDTAVVFYPSDKRADVLAFAREQEVEVVATEADLTGGLEVVRG